MPFPLILVALAPTAAQPDTDRFARWEKEVAAIEKRLHDTPPRAGGVVFAGSSSIRLWNLEKSFPGKGYANVGFGGSQVRDCTHFASRLVIPHKPRVVVLYAGDNDVAAGRKPEQVLADFKAFCTALHKDVPKCRILFVAIKPSLARWKQFDTQKKANTLVQKFCAADERLAFVDVIPAMLGTDGMPIPNLYAKDGLHMSPAGYEKWTTVINAALGK